MKRTSAKKIVEINPGELAKVIGKIEFIGEALKSPITGRAFAYCHIRVDKFIPAGKNSRWRNVIDEEISGKFFIHDGINYAHVDDQNLKTDIVHDMLFTSDLLKEVTPELLTFLNSRGIDTTGLTESDKNLRFSEGILESGELVAVLGTAEWKKSSELQIPDSYGKILHLTASTKQPVYLTDEPKTISLT